MRLPWRPVEIAGALILTSLTEREAATLRALADGRRILEVGSAYGYSALVMAEVAEHVLAVDPHQAIPDSLATMRANIVHRRCQDRISILLGSSCDALPALRACRARFDLVFIDGDHDERAVEFDIACAWTLLARGGQVACHDYGEDTCAGVRAAIDRSGITGRLEADTLWVATK